MWPPVMGSAISRRTMAASMVIAMVTMRMVCAICATVAVCSSVAKKVAARPAVPPGTGRNRRPHASSIEPFPIRKMPKRR
uniref:Uncharacterized protein n=1 Tax=Anopheles darlingi TaxID=43151 RepID=A0A2M4DHF3_ANODA